MKIDVEGAEPLVVDGLSEALSAPECRHVYCEVHLPEGTNHPSVDDFGSDAEEFQERLRELGFRVTELKTRDGQEVFLKGSK